MRVEDLLRDAMLSGLVKIGNIVVVHDRWDRIAYGHFIDVPTTGLTDCDHALPNRWGDAEASVGNVRKCDFWFPQTGQWIGKEWIQTKVIPHSIQP